jgi:hypothetical protein
MNILRHRLALLATLWLAVCLPAAAESSAASSASNSASSTVGSLSDSVKGSSDSSSKTTTVAEGEYRIIELAAFPERPGTVRLTLQALAGTGADGVLFLVVPAPALDGGRLVAGQIVTARQRPYGVEFARGDDGQAFFLALSDDWLRELQARAVTL